jgi:hypothetical protein
MNHFSTGAKLRTLAVTMLAGVIALSTPGCSNDLPTDAAEKLGPDAVQNQVAPPTNDDFDDAVVISRFPFTHSVNTSEATTAADDPVPSCAEGGQGPTVWYAFTPRNSKRIEANTFGSDYDTDLVVYTGTRGDLTEITCNDDAEEVQSKVVFDAVAGETYFIMVGAFASGPGGNLVFNLVNPSAEVFRDQFFHDAALVHIIPEHNLTFTVGLITPIGDLLECGGTEEFLSDVVTRIQHVETPQGPIKMIESTRGTFVLYDVSLFELEEFCDLAQFEIGRGQGSFTRTDNSLFGTGPGINSFGFIARATLELTDGDQARFFALFRQLFDIESGEVRTVVDKVELK